MTQIFTDLITTACVNPNKKNLRESANGAGGVSDIEGKTATGSGERVGKRASFKSVDLVTPIHGSRVSRNIRSRGAILRDLCRKPFAPFQKFIVAGALAPFHGPISRARPKTEDRAAGKIVNSL